jgi:hypothetical protein
MGHPTTKREDQDPSFAKGAKGRPPGIACGSLFCMSAGLGGVDGFGKAAASRRTPHAGQRPALPKRRETQDPRAKAAHGAPTRKREDPPFAKDAKGRPPNPTRNIDAWGSDKTQEVRRIGPGGLGCVGLRLWGLWLARVWRRRSRRCLLCRGGSRGCRRRIRG